MVGFGWQRIVIFCDRGSDTKPRENPTWRHIVCQASREVKMNQFKQFGVTIWSGQKNRLQYKNTMCNVRRDTMWTPKQGPKNLKMKHIEAKTCTEHAP